MTLAVYSFKQGGQKTWAGLATANGDGSLSIRLEVLPLDGILLVEACNMSRLLLERDEARAEAGHFKEALRHAQIARDEALADALQRKAELSKRGGA